MSGTSSAEPRAPILIFDGACRFCTAAVEWLDARLARRTRLVPWQEIDLSAFDLSERDASRTVWWIEPSGARFHSERAVAQALISCDGIWRRVGLALRAPVVRSLAAVGYRIVARNRRHLPGVEPACRRPEREDESPQRHRHPHWNDENRQSQGGPP